MGRDKRLLIFFTLTAILLRLLLLLQYCANNPFYSHPILDSVVYLDWSQAILEGKTFFALEYHHPPGYAFFLAGIFKTAGVNYLAVQFFQGLLLALDGVLIFLLTRTLFERAQAWTAFVLFNLCGPLFFYSMKILSETLYCSLLLLSFFCLLHYLRSSHQRLAFAAGLFLGAAIEVRGNAMICLLPCLIVLARRKSRGPSLKAAAALIGGVLIFLLPVLTRNVLVANAWTAVASNWGENFYFANNSDANGTFTPTPGIGTNLQDQMRDVQQEASRRSGRPLNSLEAQRFWFHEGLRFISTQPLKWIELELRKVQRLFSFREASSMYFYTLESAYFDPSLRLLFVSDGLLLLLFFAGLSFTPINEETQLLLGFIVSQALLLLVFWPELRFLLPLFPFLIIVAGNTICLTRGLPGVNVQSMAGVAGILLVLGLNLIPLSGTGGREAWFTNASAALFSIGKYEPAAEMANRGIQLNPAYESAWVNLGAALHSSGRTIPARQAWQKALSLKPDDYLALRNMALSFETEDPSRALQYWNTCLQAARTRGATSFEISAIEQQIASLKGQVKSQ